MIVCVFVFPVVDDQRGRSGKMLLDGSVEDSETSGGQGTGMLRIKDGAMKVITVDGLSCHSYLPCICSNNIQAKIRQR